MEIRKYCVTISLFINIFISPSLFSETVPYKYHDQSFGKPTLQIDDAFQTTKLDEFLNILTTDKNKTRLIYSSDIYNNTLIECKYKNQEKKNYIDKIGNNNLLLVVNRGYGKGDYKFNYCLIDITENYLIENHLICIKYKNEIEKEELKKLYQIIIKSFEDIRTTNFIKIYFGNNAINTTELQYHLPIYI